MYKKITEHTLPPENSGEYINQLVKTNPQQAGEIALQLFCTPEHGRVFSSKEELILGKSEQKRFRVNDFEVQSYRWRGAGQKILLLHGWDSNVIRWRPLISLFTSADFDVMAIDAPAHGKSGSHIAHGPMYAKAIGVVSGDFHPDIVIGHSFGGLSSIFYFGQSNQNTPIQKLVLLGTPSKLSTSIVNFHKAKGLNILAQNAMEEVFYDTFNLDYHYFTVANFIKNIKAKGLIIHDENDEVTPFEEAIDNHEAWKFSELFSTKNLGHNLIAGSVFKKVLQFCTDVES